MPPSIYISFELQDPGIFFNPVIATGMLNGQNAPNCFDFAYVKYFFKLLICAPAFVGSIYPVNTSYVAVGCTNLFFFFLQVLIYLVCHPSWAVRKIAYDATKNVLSSSGALAEDLLFLFTSWLSLVGERVLILKQR